jgi:hypothetical protein
VLTGRTRKTSRLTTDKPVKKPVAKPAAKPASEQPRAKRVAEKKPVVQKKPAEKPTKKPVEKKAASRPVEKETLNENIPAAPPSDTEESSTIAEEVKELDISLEKLDMVSHLSTCSSAATDEHDAEVAATTSKKMTIEIPVLTQSGRSSFSPTASLPRPETPEVDQLRLKFESLAQSTTIKEQIKKPTSPISRIKDMRPRGAVGTRVRSMVELFMDENLNKWEF